MNKAQKILVAILAVIIVGGGVYYFVKHRSKSTAKPISVNNQAANPTTPANSGNVSPISGLACADWNRRPFAVMQPADVSARPAAGFSDADMVFEMPVITASITRLTVPEN